MPEEATAKRDQSETQRRGPRPLALHLATAAGVWQSSRLALPLLRRRSQPAEGSATLARLAALAPELKSQDPERLELALTREIARRAESLTAGIEAYRRHPHRRQGSGASLAWQEGTTRLWDFAPGSTGRPLLLVPSLINRAYILDLDRRNSLCHWLAEQGFRPFLVDWDSPAEEERGFTLTDYIAGRLIAILELVEREGSGRPVAIGYCLGGLFALGLAELAADRLSGLALLATPWDFHADLSVAPSQLRLAALTAAPFIDSQGVLPTDGVQALFYALDPWLAVRKFQGFAGREQEGTAARAFVALEDWLNDGVPLAGPVARELLVGWYAENRPQRGLWRLAGRQVDPGRLTLDCLLFVPQADRIVPPASALALTALLPRAQVRRPSAGHIGMIVGRNAKRGLWQPLADWAASLPG